MVLFVHSPAASPLTPGGHAGSQLSDDLLSLAKTSTPYNSSPQSWSCNVQPVSLRSISSAQASKEALSRCYPTQLPALQCRTYDVLWRESMLEILDQLEAETPEDTSLAPKVWSHQFRPSWSVMQKWLTPARIVGCPSVGLKHAALAHCYESWMNSGNCHRRQGRLREI